MAVQLTAPGRRPAEQHKARARVPFLVLVALVCPPLAGIRSTPLWVGYVLFMVFYSLWALRLSTQFTFDRRLGILLSLTDLAVILPLLVWSHSVAVQVVLAAVWGLALVFSLVGFRAVPQVAGTGVIHAPAGGKFDARTFDVGIGAPLERAVRFRLEVFRNNGTRFALVVLRLLRFEESVAYYGEESSQRMLTAINRRGLRMLGPDAQNFVLPGGRIAFLFEVGAVPPRGDADTIEWIDPTDVESLAMSIGRKTCEHLVDGHRVECVVGWASAPSDGLNVDDLMYVAEAGAQSTAAFRRAADLVSVPERARVAAG